jgi:Cu/Ag efflux protein CusF
LWSDIAHCRSLSRASGTPQEGLHVPWKSEAVNAGANSVTVNGEKVEGWMDAMTMRYKVDDAAVLKNIKAGDRITATVYEGDMTLHKLQVVPKGSGDSKVRVPNQIG